MKKLGLIGYPLGHSFSKKYFAEKFEKEDIKGFTYENFEIETAVEILTVVKDNPELIGLNVTIPHKQAVIKSLDELDETAKGIGAVNTIKITERNGKKHLTGYNTDITGFEKSLEKGLKPYHSHALILGTGGAAKAVEYVLQKRNIAFRYVSRSKAKAGLTYDDLNAEIMAIHKLIINTTPLGMHPAVDKAPELPYNLIGNEHYLFDLVYNPPETMFMRKGKENGAYAQNGQEMLIGQAEAAWEIWTK